MEQFDNEVSKKMGWWDEKLRREGQKLCKEHSFTTGFLEGGGSHSLVDSYELKVRLEHILERMTMISNGSDTEKPSYLYIGSALAARSVHLLQYTYCAFAPLTSRMRMWGTSRICSPTNILGCVG